MNSREFNGFTLTEILLYVGVFVVVAGVLVNILIVVLRIGTEQANSAEVTGQLNFVVQTIQRLVRQSSNIDIATGVSTPILKLRMADSAQDPTVISLSGNVITIRTSSSAPVNLTSDQVIVNSLVFKKITQYPGHDVVSIDLAMSSNVTSQGQVQRTISSAVARVSAATFDSDVLPGGPPYIYNIGQQGSPWSNLYLSGILNLGQFASDQYPAQNGSVYYNSANNTARLYRNGSWTDFAPWNFSGTNIYNSNGGNVGIGTNAPNAPLQVTGGNIYISSPGNGLIVKSPDGSTCERIGIDNNGVVATTSILCP